MRDGTDYLAVGGLTFVPTSKLLKQAAALEAGQTGEFTTALSDAEREYLLVMAELFARDKLPVLAGGRSWRRDEVERRALAAFRRRERRERRLEQS